MFPSPSYRIAPSGPYSTWSAMSSRPRVSDALFTRVWSVIACTRNDSLAMASNGSGGSTSPSDRPDDLSNVPAYPCGNPPGLCGLPFLSTPMMCSFPRDGRTSSVPAFSEDGYAGGGRA